MMKSFRGLLFLLLIPLPAGAQLSWKVYINKDYGYSIPLPSNLFLLLWKGDPASPWQNRNKTFESKDGKVSLTISTHGTDDRTFQDFFNDTVAEGTKGRDHINYSIIKDDCCVISGTNSLGFEFYSKWVVFKDGDTGMRRYVTFDFVYPSSQRRIYDPAVAKIAREFVPDMPGHYDRD